MLPTNTPPDVFNLCFYIVWKHRVPAEDQRQRWWAVHHQVTSHFNDRSNRQKDGANVGKGHYLGDSPEATTNKMHPVMSHLHKWSTFTILCVRLTYTWSWLTCCLVANNCSCSSRKDFWKVRVCFQDSDLKQTSISTVQTWDPGYYQLFRLEVHTVHCFL